METSTEQAGRSGSTPAGSVAPALSVRGLEVDFVSRTGSIPAVRGVDLEILPGEMVALVGESGSGKSVTARAVLGLLDEATTSVRAEELRLDDTSLLDLSPRARRELRGDRMSMVFQDALSALNPVLSIGDQIGELFRLHRGASRRQARAEAVELLRLVGIPAAEKRVGDYPHQFSGGMRQRILIAMAVALRPRVLLADEPTTALDVTVQAQILELVDRLRHELGTAVLFITHDLGLAAESADRVAVMYAGRIVETGVAAEVFDDPRHPYTEALLRSTPTADGAGTRLDPIRGLPPRPGAIPAGCAFHPRCERARDRCAVDPPALRTVAPDRAAACHFAEELGGDHRE